METIQDTIKAKHIPVMLSEIVEQARLVKKENAVYFDGTLGDGGHSRELFSEFVTGTTSRLCSSDWDSASIAFVTESFPQAIRLEHTKPLLSGEWGIIKSNFVSVDREMQRHAISSLDFVLLDLGISSRQLIQRSRGFSFESKRPLDMRMDTESYTVTAYDLLNGLSSKRLAHLFVEAVGMEERVAHKVARAIEEERKAGPFGTDDDARRINEIASIYVPIRANSKRKHMHPATLIFLALRLAVNAEMMNITEGFPRLFAMLVSGGRMAVLSYHSTERETVRGFAQRYVDVISESTEQLPTTQEVNRNHRARSAILHVIVKK